MDREEGGVGGGRQGGRKEGKRLQIIHTLLKHRLQTCRNKSYLYWEESTPLHHVGCCTLTGPQGRVECCTPCWSGSVGRRSGGGPRAVTSLGRDSFHQLHRGTQHGPETAQKIMQLHVHIMYMYMYIQYFSRYTIMWLNSEEVRHADVTNRNHLLGVLITGSLIFVKAVCS